MAGLELRNGALPSARTVTSYSGRRNSWISIWWLVPAWVAVAVAMPSAENETIAVPWLAPAARANERSKPPSGVSGADPWASSIPWASVTT